MERILITDRDIGSPLELSEGDIAESALCLRESARVLKLFLKKCRVITLEELQALAIKHPPRRDKITSTKISLNGIGTVYIIPELNWQGLNLLYALATSPTTDVSSVERFNEQRVLNFSIYRARINALHQEITALSREKREVIPYFNIDKFRRACRKQKIKTSIQSDSSVLLEFPKVTIGDEEWGKVKYERIFVFVKDWMISGYVLRFKNFDFSSSWNIDGVKLHPYLDTPYNFNHTLTWISAQSYEDFVWSIKDSVHCHNYKGGGFITISELVESVNEMRYIWNQLRDDNLGRKELSKEVIKAKKLKSN